MLDLFYKTLVTGGTTIALIIVVIDPLVCIVSKAWHHSKLQASKDFADRYSTNTHEH